MVFLGFRFNQGEAMRLDAPVGLLLLLAACDRDLPPKSGNSSSVASTVATDEAAQSSGEPATATATEAGLQPGNYEITTVETIAGTGTSPARREEQCISGENADRPESFLGQITLPGCTSGEPQVSTGQIRTELRCADNQAITAVTTLRRDGWDQNVVGTGLNGSYESRQTARWIGDC